MSIVERTTVGAFKIYLNVEYYEFNKDKMSGIITVSDWQTIVYVI